MKKFNYSIDIDIDENDIQSLQPFLQNKIKAYVSKHSSLIEAVLSEDIVELETLIKEGYPMLTSDFFDEDDFLDMSPALQENLSKVFYPNMPLLMQNMAVVPQAQKMLDLVAPYLMQSHSFFAEIYLANTNNYEYALNLIENSYKKVSSSLELSSWVRGAIYNKNDNFFDAYLEIHKKAKISFTNLLEPLHYDFYLTPYLNVPPNINSWKKYYNLCAQKQINILLDTSFYMKNPSLTENYALKQIWTKIIQLLNDENLKDSKAKDFINFISKEYNNAFNIDKPEFIIIDCTYHSLIDSCKKRDLFNKISLRRIKSYRDLSVGVIENKLNRLITKAIQTNSPDECLHYFKKMSLPIQYYQSLADYIELQSSLSNNNPSLRVKKI